MEEALRVDSAEGLVNRVQLGDPMQSYPHSPQLRVGKPGLGVQRVLQAFPQLQMNSLLQSGRA